MKAITSHQKHLGLLTMWALLSVAMAPAQAKPLNVSDAADNVTRPTALQQIEPIPAPQAEVVTAMPTIVAEPIDACHVYKPIVHYRVKGHCPPCCAAKAPVETTLLVKDPAACDCYAEIPVCLPCCCVGEVRVCNRDGILGRRRVDYEWDCGFKISVLFRARGDVVVNYIF